MVGSKCPMVAAPILCGNQETLIFSRSSSWIDPVQSGVASPSLLSLVWCFHHMILVHASLWDKKWRRYREVWWVRQKIKVTSCGQFGTKEVLYFVCPKLHVVVAFNTSNKRTYMSFCTDFVSTIHWSIRNTTKFKGCRFIEQMCLSFETTSLLQKNTNLL